MLSGQALREFQEIYQKTYGVSLSLEDAQTQGSQLIRLYKTILKSSCEDQTNE